MATGTAGTQRIVKIRRAYNAWVADETMEDYALRFTARSFRKWSELRIANTALGGISFLALEAIGAVLMVGYGFSNAAWAIVTVCAVIFGLSLPISYYAARYGLDIDLLTRGAGFGYLGSTFTSLIYASFTFLFFALEAAIMGQAIAMYFGIALPLAYLISSVAIIPLVTFGITAINRLQWFTQPLWLALLILPYAAIALSRPETFADVLGFTGRQHDGSFTWPAFGAACGVALALVGQIGEQVDYLRFLPEKKPANRWRWWAAVIAAGPGWVLIGGLKMFGGALLAFLALQHQLPYAQAVEPTHMYQVAFGYVFDSPGVVLAVTVAFVVVSQVKINVTNAYAGSLAWSNFFARVTRSHPGRVVWLVFNVLIALILLEVGIFSAIDRVLGLYANVAAAWIGALAADLIINKPLGLSPKGIEFKRAHLYDINPVGIGALVLASVASVAAYTGVLGETARAAAPLLALGGAFVSAPLIAWATRGRFYLARAPAPAAELADAAAGGRQEARCVLCGNRFEVDDMAHCPAYAGTICSLCCSLDMRCGDLCRPQGKASAQAAGLLRRLLPKSLLPHLYTRLFRYALVLATMSLALACALAAVYAQVLPLVSGDSGRLLEIFLRTFLLMTALTGTLAWWLVLTREARNVAQQETSRQTELLMREIRAHERTDAKLQQATSEAEAANRAKSRYVSGLSHELRTPLNNILGYTQLLGRDPQLVAEQRDKLATIQRSSEHLLALVDGLLDIARIEAGRISLDIGEIRIQTLLEQIEAMFEPQAHAKGLAFEIERRGRIPEVVRGDEQRLRQILINLVGNAIRFTRTGTVRLRLAYAWEVATFEIIDTGPGIAEDELEQIFLPFERLGAGPSGPGGTGLGLTICQLLTQFMGGELTAAAAGGGGSHFTLRLFLARRKDSATPGQGSRPVTGYRGPRRHILIVDDLGDQRAVLRDMLQPLGFDIDECSDGPAALRWLATQSTDLIAMDVAMPDMDGFETAQLIRARALSSAPILVISANAYADDVARSQAAGCDAFLPKPIDMGRLQSTLAALLHLQWRAGDSPTAAASTPASGAETAAVSVPLPAPAARRVAAAVDTGNMAGVVAVLDALEAQDPSLAAGLAPLRAAAKRFELGRLRQLATISTNEGQQS